ncbi:GL20986 [Drosophila persimilis]|uniref:GL20986 n=1 Tax=Drosophila persimilis TaxID=7234 RepID=B4H838_DROPE|nr:GL20986 [Drosophila persimilis]
MHLITPPEHLSHSARGAGKATAHQSKQLVHTVRDFYIFTVKERDDFDDQILQAAPPVPPVLSLASVNDWMCQSKRPGPLELPLAVAATFIQKEKVKSFK